MGVFEPLIEVIKVKPFNGYIMLSFLLIILGLVLWNSVDDILKQRIVFWKLLLTGFAATFLPFIYTFFSGNGWRQSLGYGLSVVIYLAIIVLNVMFNNDKFIGKGDVDIIAAPFSLTIGATIWQLMATESFVLGANLGYIWFQFFVYVTLGLIIGTVVFLVWFVIQSFLKKMSFRLLLKDTRIPVIPTLIIPTVMVAYSLMLI